jgi:hypothetical protein
MCNLDCKAIVNVTAKMVWLQSLLRGLDIFQARAPILWFHKLSATYLTANPSWFHWLFIYVEMLICDEATLFKLITSGIY